MMSRPTYRITTLLLTLPLLFSAFVLSGCEGGETIRSTRFGEPELSGSFLFPTTAPGQTAESRLMIRNVGDGELQLVDFQLDLGREYTLEWTRGALPDAPRSLGFDGESNRFPDSISLQPNEVISLTMTYAPQGDRAPSGQVSLSTNAASDDLRELLFPVRGLSRNGELVVTPNVIDLGRVVIGERAESTVSVSNIGQVPVNIDRLIVSGSDRFRIRLDGSDPRLHPEMLADPDGDGAEGLAPGASFEVTVVHQAEFARPDHGVLTIISDAVNENLAVNLVANSEAPCLRVDSSEVAFGAAGIGQSSSALLALESCGGEPLRIDAVEIVDGATAFSLRPEELPTLPAHLPAADLEDDGARAPRWLFRLDFKPDDEQAYQGVLRLRTNDPFNAVVDIPLAGRGVHNECPRASVTEQMMNVRPLDVIMLDGSASVDVDGPDQRPLQYEWSVVERPQGSTARIVEQFDVMNAPADGGMEDIVNTPFARFFVDLAGTYVFELHVVDNRGARAPSESCQQPAATVTVTAVPEQDLHIQLVWDTPGDPDQTDGLGADVDLHLTHPSTDDWFQAAGLYDCYFGNVKPDWGTADHEDDNPSLDIDDTNGAGPENINLNTPEDTDEFAAPYRVGVHYFRDSVDEFGGTETWGFSDATVRIYIHGELVSELTRRLEHTNDFWEAAHIEWSETDQVVEEIDRLTTKIP